VPLREKALLSIPFLYLKNLPLNEFMLRIKRLRL
jgi:hypothetical protein